MDLKLTSLLCWRGWFFLRVSTIYSWNPFESRKNKHLAHLVVAVTLLPLSPAPVTHSLHPSNLQTPCIHLANPPKVPLWLPYLLLLCRMLPKTKSGGPFLPVTNKQANWLCLEEKQESVHAGAAVTCACVRGCVFARFLFLLFFFALCTHKMCVSVFVGHSRLQARLHLAAIKLHASRSALYSPAAGSCFKAAKHRTGRQHFHQCAPLCHVEHNGLKSSGIMTILIIGEKKQVCEKTCRDQEVKIDG